MEDERPPGTADKQALLAGLSSRNEKALIEAWRSIPKLIRGGLLTAGEVKPYAAHFFNLFNSPRHADSTELWRLLRQLKRLGVVTRRHGQHFLDLLKAQDPQIRRAAWKNVTHLVDLELVTLSQVRSLTNHLLELLQPDKNSVEMWRQVPQLLERGILTPTDVKQLAERLRNFLKTKNTQERHDALDLLDRLLGPDLLDLQELKELVKYLIELITEIATNA